VLIALDPSDEYPDALSVGMIDRVQGVGIEKTNTMEASMTVQEMIAQFPELKTEFERIRKEGVAEGENNLKVRLGQASKFLTAAYPEPIRALAAKVIEGEESADVLKGAVMLHDATQAKLAEVDAQVASEAALIAAPVNQPVAAPAVSTDGMIKTQADIENESARLRDVK
jgi:hypothetical protein